MAIQVPPQTKTYTAEDLWALSALPENELKRLEISEGKLIELPLNGFRHGVIAARIGALVGELIRQQRLGYVTVAAGHILSGRLKSLDTVRAPDVGFIAKDRLPEGLPNKYIPFAPDIAVEVVSPNDTASEIQKKVQEYLRYGTQLVLVAYPDTESIVAHTKDGARTYSSEETLGFGDVLAGFTLAVREIFE